MMKDLDAIAPADPMEYFRKFGEDGIGVGLSASDSRCNETNKRLCGLLQTQVPDRGRYACAYLTPDEMRDLASELFNLASIIETENLVLEKEKEMSVFEELKRLDAGKWEFRPNGSDGGLDKCLCIKGEPREYGLVNNSAAMPIIVHCVNNFALVVEALRSLRQAVWDENAASTPLGEEAERAMAVLVVAQTAK